MYVSNYVCFPVCMYACVCIYVYMLVFVFVNNFIPVYCTYKDSIHLCMHQSSTIITHVGKILRRDLYEKKMIFGIEN